MYKTLTRGASFEGGMPRPDRRDAWQPNLAEARPVAAEMVLRVWYTTHKAVRAADLPLIHH